MPDTTHTASLRKIQPLRDQVLVRRAIAEAKSTGGIIIPENAQEKASQGEVLAVGPGRVLTDGSVRPLDVKPGDVVLWSKHASQHVKARGAILDDEHIVLKEDDLLAVVVS